MREQHEEKTEHNSKMRTKMKINEYKLFKTC